MRHDVIFILGHARRRTLEEWGLDAGCEGFDMYCRRLGLVFYTLGVCCAKMGYVLSVASSVFLLPGCIFFILYLYSEAKSKLMTIRATLREDQWVESALGVMFDRCGNGNRCMMMRCVGF